MVDYVRLYVTPHVLGPERCPLLAGRSFSSADLRDRRVVPLGPDVLIEGYVHGPVEGVGELVERKPTSGGCRLRIATPLASELTPGDSVAVNGVCLTVILADRRDARRRRAGNGAGHDARPLARARR